MRKLALLIATLPLAAPGFALAEQVVLRIEAKRGAETQSVAAGWAARFPNVVTFPLKGGWTGIALGPMERDAAEAELARLKAAGDIPADSFIAPAPADATAVPGTAPVGGTAAASAAPAGPAQAASTFVPPGGAGEAPDTPQPAGDAGAASQDAAPGTAASDGGSDSAASAADAPATDAGPDAAQPATDVPPPAQGQTADAAPDPASAPATAEPDAAATPAAAAPAGDFLRLQRLESRDLADEALAKWRKDFPETGLWQHPDGAFSVTLGPMPADTAKAWLGAFRNAERVGKPAAVLPAAELGTPIDAGSPPDLPGPGTAEMPPLTEIQRALRWAGHYDGKIDGKDGPQTRAAIAAEVVALRAAPDAATAMQALIDRREAWRRDMGLTRLDDPQSGLSVIAPMDRLEFDRNDQGLSVYRPRDGSGAALILYGAPGGQQEMLDFTGLVTALGWVPSPDRRVEDGHASLKGRNATHIGQAEARVVDGRVEGLVLIWPVMDEEDQPRVAAELIDSLAPTATLSSVVPEGALPPDAADGAAAPTMPAPAK